MNDRSNRTVICSIAFVDIVDYSKRVGQEQLALKERFNALIGEVVQDIAQQDQIKSFGHRDRDVLDGNLPELKLGRVALEQSSQTRSDVDGQELRSGEALRKTLGHRPFPASNLEDASRGG